MAEPLILPVSKSGYFKGSMMVVAAHDHVHLETGVCIKDREGECPVGIEQRRVEREKQSYALPIPGLTTRKVHNWGDSSAQGSIEEIRPTVSDPRWADLITSEVFGQEGTHKIVLDIDFPVVAVPSSTEGHSHLYIDRPISWKNYLKLIRAMVKAGLVEPGYLGASEQRGFTGVRPPWVKKTPPAPEPF